MENYFELFDIPVQLKVDKGAVKKKYFELSRQFHPDYFINNDDAAQQQALEESAKLNKALKTFNSVDETIAYVLTLKGLLIENEKYELPPDFLMEMMELNEAVADAAFDDDGSARQGILQQVEKAEKEIYEPVQNIIADYQEGVTTEKELLQVKDYYFKKKYILRLKHQLEA